MGGEFMQKYIFSIRTRDGQLIRSLTIAGRDQEEAERKLKQMYRYCEIVSGQSCGQEARQRQDIMPLFAKQEGVSA